MGLESLSACAHLPMLVSSFLLVETLSRSGRDRLSIALNFVLVGILVIFCHYDKNTLTKMTSNRKCDIGLAASEA